MGINIAQGHNWTVCKQTCKSGASTYADQWRNRHEKNQWSTQYKHLGGTCTYSNKWSTKNKQNQWRTYKDKNLGAISM